MSNSLLPHPTSATASTSQPIQIPSHARQQLRERLIALPAPAFAQLVTKLLSLSGYVDVQVLQCGKRRFTPRAGTCGGVDLQASTLTDLAHSLTVVQIKQYRQPVPRRFVDELRGAMLRIQARHGLLVTTSIFSSAARKAASQEHTVPVRLLDGEELLDLLFLHKIGTQLTSSGTWSVNLDFFAQLEASYRPSVRANRKSPDQSRREQEHVPRPDAAPELIPNENDMMWRTHALVGLNTLWLWHFIPNSIRIESIALLATAATLGALLPDLDASNSKIKHLEVAGIKPLVPLSNALHRSLGHRGLLHSLWGASGAAALASPLLLWEWSQPAFVAFLLGYGSHLAADACTKSGIPLFLPRRRRYHLLPRSLRITTGSIAEEVLFPFLVTALLVLLLRSLPFGGAATSL